MTKEEIEAKAAELGKHPLMVFLRDVTDRGSIDQKIELKSAWEQVAAGMKRVAAVAEQLGHDQLMTGTQAEISIIETFAEKLGELIEKAEK